MRQETFKIKGMHCASCASIIEKSLQKSDGVQSVQVNYGTETAQVSFDDSKTNPAVFSKKIEQLGYSLILPISQEPSDQLRLQKHIFSEMKKGDHEGHLGLDQSKSDKIKEINSQANQLLYAIPITAIVIFIMTWDILSAWKILPIQSIVISEFFHHLLPVMATYILFVVGRPYLLGMIRFFRYGVANMDSLVGIGTFVAFIYSFIVTAFEYSLEGLINVHHTYYDVTVVVIVFITLGKYLEAKSKLKTGDAIEKLLALQAKTAFVVRDGREQEVPIEKVVLGDVVLVKPGQKIPVDGKVLKGEPFIDESMVTGEPMPVQKHAGELVVAGTINTTGVFYFKATKVGSETLLSQIVRMVQEAQASKAPIQSLADRVSAIFVPIVILISCLSFGAWLIVGSYYLSFATAVSFGLTSFVGVLVIACPCALGLATPTAIIVGVGKGAKEGILIKDAATLQKLHKVNTVVMDKTGTVTRGKPEMAGIKNYSDLVDEKVISILASLEKNSEHPIAHAIIEYSQKNAIDTFVVKNFAILKGKGLRGELAGVEYFAGSIKFINDLGLSFQTKEIESEALEGKTPVILATGKKVIAAVMVADKVKPEAVSSIENLHKIGIKTVMLTGDNKNTAHAIAKQVGIDEVFAQVLPEEKLNIIKKMQAEGRIVAMAGDGVNDAPALAAADVGIAMATGTDVAIEAAGITLLQGNIAKIAKAINLSRMTMRGIKQNLFWAFIYNIIGIPLAAGVFYPFSGWLLSPVFAGMAMAFSSVSVVANSLRIKAKNL